MAEGMICSPQMLWDGFDDQLPLDDSIISEETNEEIVIRKVVFSGRQTEKGRVKIFGVFAFAKQNAKQQPKSTILIIQDFDETINMELMNIYLKQGYNVFMVDYRGGENSENATVYPEDVSYANFEKADRRIDFVDETAKETCWYEWTAVMRYAVSYLKSQENVSKIGVIGVKNGSNLGWMLCGTDSRIDCFVSLFGAGWRAYKGKFKNSEDNDIEMTPERMRFLAGVEAQSYAQSVKCPVFYLTATNNPDFDIDRSVDTLTRMPTDRECVRFNCYSPKYRDVLNGKCRVDIDLFLAKYLLGFNIDLPFEPKLTIDEDRGRLLAKLEFDFSETKKVKRADVYVAEGVENPAFREWDLMVGSSDKVENCRSYTYKLNGNSDFVAAFALVEYRGGITVCSKIQFKKIQRFFAKDRKLIFSAIGRTDVFSIYDAAKHSACGLFLNDDDYVMIMSGSDGVSGAYSKYGLVSYRVGNIFVRLFERSIIEMDVSCAEDTVLSVVLMTSDEQGVVDYTVRLGVKKSNVWQNIVLTCAEFKSQTGTQIKDFSAVCAMRIESEEPCVVNNILVI